MSKAHRFDLVIFDWDGTLMNSEARIVDSIQSAAQICGLPVLPHHDSKQIIGLSLDNAIRQLYSEIEPGLVVEVAKAYTQHFLHDSVVDMQPYEGAQNLLSELHGQGVKLAVATGKSRIGLDAVLALTGFEPYFHITRTPVESASKPDPLMLKQILAFTNMDVSQAVMVGDTSFDMQMAQAIQMPRVAMSHGVHTLEQMASFEPMSSFEDLGALGRWLLS